MITRPLSRGDFNLGDVGSIAPQIGVTGGAGFDGGDFAVAEEAEKIAQPPAGEGHVMGGEKQLEAILGASAFCSKCANCSSA
jgi:hypothetical protein